MTVDHIPREISRHCFYYIKEGGVITGHVSPIPADDLEISLLLTFSVEQKRIHKIMKDFVGNLYGYMIACASNDQSDYDSGKK